MKMNFFGKKGLTMIEVVIGIGIFAFAMAGVSIFISTLYRSQAYGWRQTLAINEARKGVETMVRELREAQEGDDGSYTIEKAADHEIIFYSDIDKDSNTERVRYFLGSIVSGIQTKNCFTNSSGGSCSVSFSDFFTGTLVSAQLKVTTEGDLGAGNEYAEIFVDGQKFGNSCQTGCSDCAGVWQGTAIYNVTSLAADNSLQMVADGTSQVGPGCNWENPGHSLKAQFELSWTEEVLGTELNRGVIEPTSPPVRYPLENEQITVLSSFVHNAPPIFEYFDQNGQKIVYYPARLVDTKLLKVFLVVDVDTNRPPAAYELESAVRLRNLRNE